VNLVERVSSLRNARRQMIEGLESLGDEDVQRIFAKQDVNITGLFYASKDNITRTITLFQAAEAVENAVQYILNLEKPVSEEGYEAFNFLGINILDDFLSKCNEITNIFINSVEAQRKSFQTITHLCLIVTPFALLGVIFILVIIILNQYRIGNDHMQALIKLKPNGIKRVQNRLIQFQKNLRDGDGVHNPEYLDYIANLGSHILEEKEGHFKRKNRDQVIIYREFRRRHFRYVIRVTLYLFVLILVILWNYFSTEHSTKIIYNKQNQLEFANYISERASVGYAAFAALYLRNNTIRIEGDSSLNALKRGAREIIQIQSKIPSAFLNVDGKYDAEVRKILYGKFTCKNLDDALSSCNYMLGKGQPVNMLATIAPYSTTIGEKVTDYNTANKSTTDTLLAAGYRGMEFFLHQYVVITTEAQRIADIVDLKLTDEIESSNKNRGAILVVFSVALMFVSILIWFDVLMKLREIDNDFKKVLQVFPSRIVLSSFLLLKFLKKTSNEPLIL